MAQAVLLAIVSGVASAITTEVIKWFKDQIDYWWYAPSGDK